MSNLTPFEFENCKIRVLTNDEGMPWFVAKDIAVALGYSDTTQAVRKNCKHAKSLIDIGASMRRPQQNQEIDPQTKLIPEGDIYRLVAKSTLPGAEQFET